MAFNYDLSLLSGQVRLYIGDSIEFQGPRPSGINYADDEIAFFISQGNTSAFPLTGGVIAAVLALAGEWSAYALMERSQNLQFSAITTAERYRAHAKYLLNNPIEESGKVDDYFIPLTRKDAYSESEIVC